MSSKARWRQFRAWFGGYFWLPCPVCGKMEAGFEDHGELLVSEYRSKCTCGDCPGQWIVYGDTFAQLVPIMTITGPRISYVTASSEWKATPLRGQTRVSAGLSRVLES